MADTETTGPERHTEGIECPRCGCRHLYVVYTRHRGKKVLRLRECRHCGRRIMTYEQACG